jgi:hypothetical protein
MSGGQSSGRKASTGRTAFALFVGGVAAAFPLLLIVYFLKGADLVAVPQVQNPTSQNYVDAIGHVASTSESLITIALTILGANVIWFLKGSQTQPIRHVAMYVAFVGCVVSIYFGVKLGYSVGLTLSGAEPDIDPLLKLLRNQALFALLSGLLLTGVVVFTSLTREGS